MRKENEILQYQRCVSMRISGGTKRSPNVAGTYYVKVLDLHPECRCGGLRHF